VRYLLDTCVISEFVKPKPAPAVLAWLRECDESSLYLSVLTLGEIRKGVERLPTSRRRQSLEAWLEKDVRERFRGRLLDVTEDIALEWGRIQGAAEVLGQPLPVVDSLLGATALAYDLTVATRNDTDVGRSGARVVDPWLTS
jgi:predicted nucleic acid-binding protein